MTTHAYHEDTHSFGLADGCERCAEHAEHPRESLDTHNLANLWERIDQGLPARSKNEARAMEVLSGGVLGEGADQS